MSKRKSKSNIFYKLYRYINIIFKVFLFSYISIINTQVSPSEISLVIDGDGNQTILNENFYKDPDNVIVNGETRNDCKKFCVLTTKPNNIQLQFYDDITTCENMFYGASDITEIDFSSFDSFGVTSMKNMFKECTNLISIKFGNFRTSSVVTMESLFRDCKKIEYIDLSNFVTTSLTNMLEVFSHCESLISMDLTSFKTTQVTIIKDLFAYCYKLVSVNLSSFDTSNVDNMQGIFFCCYQLKYIDLENFRTNSLRNLWYTFGYCRSLIYLNLRYFKISDTQNVDLLDTFKAHPTTTKYCIEDLYTKNYLLSDIDVDCLNLCFKENAEPDIQHNECVCNENNKFEFENTCYHICPNNMMHVLNDKYICSFNVPENYYLDNSDNIYKECYSTCKNCSQGGNNERHNCQECKEGLRFINDPFAIENNCYRQCSFYSYFIAMQNYQCTQSCIFTGFQKKIEPKKKCIDDCKNDDEYIYEYNNECLNECPENTKTYVEGKKCVNSCTNQQFEYNNKCYDDCPSDTKRLFNIKRICAETIPENYYLDNNNNIYKKCYDKCKKCSQLGDDTNNQCDECKDGYKFITDTYANSKNCYSICNYNYYFTGYNQYVCTNSNECPSPYNKLISDKKKCIDDCKNDNQYIYDYNNNCKQTCPTNTKKYEDQKLCLDDCYTELFEYNNECLNDCPSGKHRIFIDRNICAETIPENYYLDNNDNIYKKCYDKCKKCSQLGDDTNNQCDECKDGYKFITDTYANSKNCYSICNYNYYFTGYNQYVCTNSNECPSPYNKLISDKKKCIDDCKNDNQYIYDYNNNCKQTCPTNTKKYEDQKLCLDDCYTELFEYNNECLNDCPSGKHRIFIDRNRCTDELPEGFVLDNTDNIYKKCFETCKVCNQVGNDDNNNCEQCIDNYKFLDDSFAKPKNCYYDCDNYYMFDSSNQYMCIDSCPPEFKNLISQRKKCIDDCQKDDDYIFTYEEQCLLLCPDNLKIDDETKYCLISCYPEQFECENICYSRLPSGNDEFFHDKKIYINNLENFENIVNMIFEAYPPEIGNKILLERPDNRVYEITNSLDELDLLQNKTKNIWGLSIVDLGFCETILKRENNISENDSLIFIKNEIKSNKVSERNVHIDVYNPNTRDKLNLSLCEEIPVNIYLPMELSIGTKQLYDKMKKSGYDLFNINDPFYQDVCTPFDSSNGTDILLTDRIDYIYYNEDTKCQSNCLYTQYTMETKYISCSCSINEEVNNEHKKSDKFNPKKIYESFYEVLKYSNYDIIKCYKIILNIKVITINLGSLIVILYFICYLICLFIFIFRGIIPIRIKLRNNLYKEQKNFNLYIKFNINKLLYPPIKKKQNPKFNFKKGIQNRNKIIFNKNIIQLNINRNSNFDYIKNINSYSSSSFNAVGKLPYEKYNDPKINGTIKSNNRLNEKKLKIEYSDYELNELEYERAIKLDKRTLCQLYCAILKREHLIIFTFFNCDDYNLLSVKVSRCIFLMVGDMALNVFFFSDDSMHKLFLTYGKYDFIQQIPQITYSTIISQIIEVFLCYLSLTDTYIYLLKKNLVKRNIRIIKSIIKYIRIKLVMYFIFLFIFFSIYWYIISVFCGVYRNTQIAFIKDSIISFTIGLIYHFVLYFISASLRICSLRSSKKDCKCLYNFSYIIPFF